MAETLRCFERGDVPRAPQERDVGETLEVISEDLLEDARRRLAEGRYSHFAD